jgi:cytochrome P450
MQEGETMADLSIADDVTFIVGPGRCGSAMLSRILGDHPEVLSLSELIGPTLASPGNTNIISGMGGREVWQVLSSPDPFMDSALRAGLPIPEITYPCGSGRFGPATGIPRICLAALPGLTDDPDALYDRLAAEVPTWPRRDAADHYHALFGCLAPVPGRRVVVERSAGSLLHVQILHDVFPRARFVHIYRDGPDCALSMSRHTGFRRIGLLRAAALAAGLSWPSPWEAVMASLPGQFTGLLTPPFDPWRYMAYPIPLTWFGDYWSHTTTEGIAALRKLPGDSWMSVKYEDLLSEPEAELTRLAGFLAVSPSPEWLAAARRLILPRRAGTARAYLDPDSLRDLRLACAPGVEAIQTMAEPTAPPSPSASFAETGHLGPDYFQDPLGHYALMRAEAPVSLAVLPDAWPAWFVTGYAEVRAALTDPRLLKDWRKRTQPGRAPAGVNDFINTNMLNMDPPDHTRLRRLVLKAFTPRRIAALRPRVVEITSSLIDAMSHGNGTVDLLEAFALPLPVTVICELLGIPGADQERFSAWAHTVVATDATEQELREAREAMHGYYTSLLAAKRRSPSDDLLSALVTARDDESLSEPELIALVYLLLTAGHETTVNLIANGTLALLTHPGELARLRDDASLLPSAVEELLRYASPLNHATERFTLEPTKIGDVTIPANKVVICATSAANHDPARFPDPGRLDLSRDTTGHLAFGHGIHYCLGAPLARLEAEVAFGSLLSRFPALSLAVPASELRWRPSSFVHGLEALPVRLGADARPDRGKVHP